MSYAKYADMRNSYLSAAIDLPSADADTMSAKRRRIICRACSKSPGAAFSNTGTTTFVSRLQQSSACLSLVSSVLAMSSSVKVSKF